MDYYEKGEEKFGVLSSKIYSFSSSRLMKKFYEFIARDVAKYEPKTILDIGAGPGYLVMRLSAVTSSHE